MRVPRSRRSPSAPASPATCSTTTSRAGGSTSSSPPSKLAGRELTGHWNTDPDTPLDERLAANFAGLFDHALEPTDAWLVHRQARIPGEPEIDAVDERYRALVVASISENHFGTPEPPPYARLAIRAFIDFGDRALDECRIEGLDRDEVTGMLAKTLLAVVEAAKDSEA